MKPSRSVLHFLRSLTQPTSCPSATATRLRSTQRPCPLLKSPPRRHQSSRNESLADLVNNPPTLVSTNRKRGRGGLVILAIIPLTAFALGTWQIQRLGWKSELIARFEDRLVASPLPLPPNIDTSRINEFDYRRVYTTGVLRHDREILVGPRVLDGADGFQVITPLERKDGSTILISRGWIAREFQDQRRRGRGALPRGPVTVSGLLREPWKKNMFTPANVPEKSQWYFPDVAQIAQWTDSTPVLIEETMQPDLIESMNRQAAGIPVGRAAEVNLRNNHTQYIFTWYSLGIATSIMFYMVAKKPPSGVAARVRKNVEW